MSSIRKFFTFAATLFAIILAGCGTPQKVVEQIDNPSNWIGTYAGSVHWYTEFHGRHERNITISIKPDEQGNLIGLIQSRQGHPQMTGGITPYADSSIGFTVKMWGISNMAEFNFHLLLAEGGNILHGDIYSHRWGGASGKARLKKVQPNPIAKSTQANY